MASDDYIKLYRSILTNKIWLKKEPFTWGQAWIDLLLLAWWHPETGCLWVRGIQVPIRRGQVGWSERSLAERWHWSRNKVRHFIEYLKTEQQIEPQKNNITLVISITNYDKLQKKDHKKSHKRATKEPQMDPNKEGKEGKEGKEERDSKNKMTPFPLSPFFKFETFREALHDWPEQKVRFFYDLFIECEELRPGKYKYANWPIAARKWDRKEPEQWQGKKSSKRGVDATTEAVNNFIGKVNRGEI